jgi:SAM-dependent methyltransferase
MRRKIPWIGFVVLFWIAQISGGGVAKDRQPAPLAFPKPNRPVASIVSPIWHSEAERDAVNEVPQVAQLLGIELGMTVADVGAGSGFYVTRLAQLVGPSGRIIAEDITPAYLRQLEEKVQNQRLANVTVIAGDAADPKLPPGSADRAVLVHMYHEVSEPFALLYNLATALKPGAKIGIVDANRPILKHGTPPDLLRCEVESVGYRQTGLHVLNGFEAYLAIFDLPAGSNAHAPTEKCAR